MTTSIAASAGRPVILLISDEPVNGGHLQHIRQLFGERTCEADITFSPDHRSCHWPLRVAYPTGVVNSLSFHVYLCASFLKRRGEVVERIRALGCNLELYLHVPDLAEPFSMTVSTMKQLSELHIQFSLWPAAPDGGVSE